MVDNNDTAVVFMMPGHTKELVQQFILDLKDDYSKEQKKQSSSIDTVSRLSSGETMSIKS